MLNQDPNAIYDPQGIDQLDSAKPKPSNKKPVQDPLEESHDPGYGFVSGTNVKEYAPYIPEGVHPENGNLDFMRGSRQSIGEQLGLRVANLVPNMLGQVLGMIGYTGALASEWGDDTDYSNAFTQAADQLKDLFGKTYRHDNSVIAPTDSAFWIDSIFGLAETAIPFAGEAAFAGNIMSRVASGASKIFGLSQRGARIAQGIGQLGTAGFSAYTEAAMDGATVFQQTYNIQLQKLQAKGIPFDQAKEQAKHIAAQSAATTVQLSTAATTLLNLTSVSPFFKKSDDVTRDILKNQLRRETGESVEQWAGRIKNLKVQDFAKHLYDHHGIAKYAQEAFQEGFEEVEQQFAQNTGQEEGEKGTIHGFLDQFKQIDHFFDRTMDQQGALSFALGALGGVAQTALIHTIVPSKFTTINKEGQQVQAVDKQGNLMFDKKGEPLYERKLVTPRVYDEWSTNHVFNNTRDALANDITRFGDLQGQYINAVRAGNEVEADKLRMQMFNVANLHAIKTNMADPWKATYDEIASMDNNEAVQRGYAKDANDNEYKTKAQQASNNITKYQQEYNKLVQRYGADYEGHLGVKAVVDNLFARKVDLMATEDIIKHHEDELKKRIQQENELVHVSNPLDFNEHLGEFNRQIDSAKEVHRRLTADLGAVKAALESNDIEAAKKLIQKYRAVGINDSDINSALTNLTEKIQKTNDLQAKKVQQAEENLRNSSGYTTWAENNPDKSFSDYREEVQKKYDLSESNRQYQADIEDARARHSIAASNYNDIVAEKSVHKFMSKATNWMNKIQENTDKILAANRAEIASRIKDKATLSKLEKIQMNENAEKFRAERDKHLDQLSDTKLQIANLQKEIENTSKLKEPRKYLNLRKQLLLLNKQATAIEAQSRHFDQLYNDYKVDTSTEEEKVDVEQVTTEPDETTDTSTPVPEAEVKPVTPTIEDEIAAIEAASPVVQELQEQDIAADQLHEAVRSYSDIIQSLPLTVREEIAPILDSVLNDTTELNMDLLQPQIDAGTISQEDAAKLLLALRDMKESEDNLITELEQGATIEETPHEPVQVDMVDQTTTDSPVIAFPSESIADILPGELGMHMGKKTVNVLSLANSTIGYHEVERGGKYYKVTDKTALNKDSNPDLLRPGKLDSGHPIRLEVDPNYNGAVNIDDELIQDEFGARQQRKEDTAAYFRNGKVIPSEHNIGNVPIKVVDAITGETVGYIRRLDWVEAKYPNTSDYRNVVDTLYDEYGNPIDNMAIQKEAILALRNKVIEQYNANGAHTEGIISGKGTGTLIRNINFNTNTEKGKLELGYARSRNPEKSLLPDPNLQIAIVYKNIAYTGKGYEFKGPKGYTTVNLNDGNVVAMVPSANGQHLYVPLVGQPLAEGARRSSVTTVARAIELYLSNDGNRADIVNEMKDLQSNTGHDISTEEGLRNFINQWFTYTESFNNSITSPNAPAVANGKRERFLFSISDTVEPQTKSTIKIGWAFSGRPVVTAKLVNGALDPAFVEALEEGFNSRARAVVFTKPNQNLKGINSTGTFKDVIYTTDGKWKYTEYPSYNEYVKSFSKTGIYGRNQLDDGTYVYTANPTMPISVDIAPSFPTLEIHENTTGTEIQKPTEDANFNKHAADIFDQLMNFSINQAPITIQARELGTGPENSKPMTEQTLQELYNFTPEANRNGRTVREVYEQLAATGHTFLAEGYNPFTRCL